MHSGTQVPKTDVGVSVTTCPAIRNYRRLKDRVIPSRLGRGQSTRQIIHPRMQVKRNRPIPQEQSGRHLPASTHFPVLPLNTCSGLESSLLPLIGCGDAGKKTKAHSWAHLPRRQQLRRQPDSTTPRPHHQESGNPLHLA